MRPIGIDLFSGAGGLTLGFEQAGFDVVAAVDIDPVHCAVHHFNFPGAAVIPRSVDNLSAARIRGAAGIGDPDLLKLDVSGAAACFGVDPLPNKRDRKSGAKKRRQVDIEAERLMLLGVNPAPSSPSAAASLPARA